MTAMSPETRRDLHEIEEGMNQHKIGVTLCTDNHYALYADTMAHAIRRYVGKVRAGIQQENQNWMDESKPAHVRRVSLIVKRPDGSIKFHVDSDVMACPCSDWEEFEIGGEE